MRTAAFVLSSTYVGASRLYVSEAPPDTIRWSKSLQSVATVLLANRQAHGWRQMHRRVPGLHRRTTKSIDHSMLRFRGGASSAGQQQVIVSSGQVTTVPSTPFEGQKPGTSGLRKRTSVFMQPSYLENFIQSLFDSLPQDELRGSTLVVSGDGRYHNLVAIQTIIKMAAARGVSRIWVGRDGLLSTPAVSCVIREREGGIAYGGILLTASHNPGGVDGDFGIKYNVQNGGPALESLTDAVHERSKEVTEYKLCADLPDIDLSHEGRYVFRDAEGATPYFEVEVIDPTEDYAKLMQQYFDFNALRDLLSRPDMDFVFDGMHGVAGPYARAIFGDLLGVQQDALINCSPSEDFGGGHPDPNLVYAETLASLMGLNGQTKAEPPVLGAAADGDADRNMIVGRRFFVTPSDSLAVIAAHADALPGMVQAGGLKALARSMPTSGAVDRVAAELGVPLFEVPTGWKYFGNLMDSHLLGGQNLSPLLCGEESFGTGSSHIREKDGLWAVLSWLSILAHHNTNAAHGQLIGVDQIVMQHWRRFGRNFYTRYDYENVDAAQASEMVERLREMARAFVQNGYSSSNPELLQDGSELATIDEFSYEDPVDKSVTEKQGMRLIFLDGSRIIIRLSGTGSVGATIRIYIERYQAPGDDAALTADSVDALRPLVELALDLSQVRELTGCEEPTVIT